MTLTRTLQLKEKYLQCDDLRALEYCEKRYQQEGCPTERWQVINFLEKMLRELKQQGGYPKVLLFRKKQIQRLEFQISEPAKPDSEEEACDCAGGWLTAGRPCPCPKGEPHREQLRKWGMQI